MNIPKVLVIAGSDSSGGAGLEADQRTLAAHGVFAMTATTALTAQNTVGVDDVHITPPEFVGKQINKVMEDGFLAHPLGVVKIGMLASAATIDVVARTLREWQEKTGQQPEIILDPVMIATSGAQLLPGDAVRKLRELILPMTTILTPNIPEATLLLRDADIEHRTPSNLDDLKVIAKKLQSLGPKHVLLKGGHMPLTKAYTKAQTEDEKEITIDILYPEIPSAQQTPDGKDEFTIIESTHLKIPNTHGTGCSLASALAANISLAAVNPPHQPLPHSVRSAIKYVQNGILTSSTLQRTLHSHGSGPINHFHSSLHFPFPLNHFIDYLLTHPRITPSWHRFTHHPFPLAMANNTLPRSKFKTYLIQDYHYLVHFARTYALAAYKSRTIATISACASIINGIETEMSLHLDYCLHTFNLSKRDIEAVPESIACTAYSRYILDIGHAGDLLTLYIALAPCLIGYYTVASHLANDPQYVRTKEGNLYWRWIENYVSESYTQNVRTGRELIEAEVVRLGGIGTGKCEELVEVFERCTQLECGFWDEALRAEDGDGDGDGDGEERTG